MGACGSNKNNTKKPTQISSTPFSNGAKIEKTNQEDKIVVVKATMPPTNTQPQNVVKSRNPEVNSLQHKIKFLLADTILFEASYPSQTQFGSMVSELKSKIEGKGDFDYHLIDSTNGSRSNITARFLEPISAILPKNAPEMQTVEIELIYAGLAISQDSRKGEAESCCLVATPKYDPSPFEIIAFNKMSNSLVYQTYPDESFNYLTVFNEFSAYCNGGNKFFISGSDKKIDDAYISTFVEIDLQNLSKPNHVRKLPDLLTGRGWHSMIFVAPRYVFIVGGMNTKSVELYDIDTNKISHDSNLNENRSESSLCVVNNSHLFAFCGFLLNYNFINSIEKCNLKAKKRTWEIVNLITGTGCIFEPSFFSVAFGSGNSIILIGGNENNRSKGNNYIFEMKNNADTVENYQLNTSDEHCLCSEKFFMPINEKSSILMPVYTSDVVKILLFDSEFGTLNTMKFEVMDTTDEDIRPSLADNADKEKYVKINDPSGHAFDPEIEQKNI